MKLKSRENILKEEMDIKKKKKVLSSQMTTYYWPTREEIKNNARTH